MDIAALLRTAPIAQVPRPDRVGMSARAANPDADVAPLRRAEAELRERALQLRLALDASDQGTWRFFVGAETKRLDWDARCKALFGFAPNAQVTYEDWRNALRAEDRVAAEAAIARALDPHDPNDGYATEYPVVHADGRLVRVSTLGRVLFEPDESAPGGRRALWFLGTMRDVTSERAAEQQRERTAALLSAIVETAPGLIYAKDLQGRMLIANGPSLDLIGKPWADVEGRTDREFLDDAAQGEAIMANDRRILASGQAEEVEEYVGDEGGRARVWSSTKAPLRTKDGTVIGLVGVSVEITERKRNEERLRLMVDELNHRVKNTLATVQAIAAQSLRGIDPEVRSTLDQRLVALAAAHDVLTRTRWQSADLREVIDAALAPFSGPGDLRFHLTGPPISLRPAAALAMAMGLHELATNALKYGPLSTPHGHVDLGWEVTAGPIATLRLRWRERGGPPVTPPTRRGFGLRLLERGLAQDLSGSVSLDFADSAGVTCRIDVPVAAASALDPLMPLPARPPACRDDRP